jgi:hypothetical protein
LHMKILVTVCSAAGHKIFNGSDITCSWQGPAAAAVLPLPGSEV